MFNLNRLYNTGKLFVEISVITVTCLVAMFTVYQNTWAILAWAALAAWAFIETVMEEKIGNNKQ